MTKECGIDCDDQEVNMDESIFHQTIYYLL
jgi:hypothetical protein